MSVILEPDDGNRYMGGIRSRPRLTLTAVEAGAVSEVKHRVRWANVDEYLSGYARWYLPVDQQPESGRKLLSVLTREHGDGYNLVFLYRYDSAYKQDYYPRYRRAFFQYHVGRTVDLVDYYKTTVAEWDDTWDAASEDDKVKARMERTRDALRPDDSPTRNDAEALEQTLAEETIQKIDLRYAAFVEAEEASWNFEVNVCKVAQMHDARDAGTPLWKFTRGLTASCSEPEQQSMLQRAVRELEW